MASSLEVVIESRRTPFPRLRRGASSGRESSIACSWPNPVAAAVAVRRALEKREIVADADERSAVTRKDDDRALAEHDVDRTAFKPELS
jgi:hypothetical protein